METNAITIQQLAEHRGLKANEDGTFSGGAYEAVGLAILGGCEGCGATLAAYNAHPSKSGNWRCSTCIGDDGWEDVAEANRAIFGDKIRSINLDPSKPLDTSDTGLLNQIEDLLVNQFGEDERDEISGDQMYELLRHIADDLLDTRNKPAGQWKTECPVCGGQLYVTEVYVNATGKKAFQHEELHADGFYVPAAADLKDGSTQDEVVTCGGDCGRTYRLDELTLG